VVQGIGAALLTPQTLSTITRIFPPERRGVAMSVWGATAGVATLVGPLAGGILVGWLGWQWIFFVNVPFGIIGFALAVWLIPVLPTAPHRFDLLGVALSGLGMFLIVFALQEGHSHDWAPWVWGMLAGGVGVMVGFVYWQSVNSAEPLIPLNIFTDRDFSLANVGVATIGFVVTSMILPLMFFVQSVCGLSPIRSALLIAPTAIASGLLAPLVGRIVDRAHPLPVVGFGFATMAVSLTWLSIEMTPTTPIWRLVLPQVAIGVAMAFIWSPLAATATRNLSPSLAGAGSGVYNATRQVGSVLGSAGIAAFMTWEIGRQLPGPMVAVPRAETAATVLPGFLHEPFATAMAQAMLLPAFVSLFGVVAALFLRGFGDRSDADDYAYDDGFDDEYEDEYDDVGYGDEPTEVLRVVGPANHYLPDYPDDDEYVEYTLEWDEPEHAPDPVTDPLGTPAVDPVPAPVPPTAAAEADDPWQAILNQLMADLPANPSDQLIGHAHNGFHVDEARHFRPLEPPDGEHRRVNGHHYGGDTDDNPSYGRHSRPGD
jgi:MFS family permease